MLRLISFCLFLVMCGIKPSSEVSLPNLYWSMSEVEGVTLYPDIGNRSVWISQLNISGYETIIFKNFTSDKSGVIVEDIHGAALLLDRFNLRVGIPFNRGCLFDLNLCSEGGITAAMWIFVRNWSDGLISSIFGTSLWYFNGPGIALYEDITEPNFKAVAILGDGSTYFAAFNRNLIGKRWSHVTMTWSRDRGIKLYVNGSEVSYTQGPGLEVNLAFNFIEQLRFGGNRSDLIIDEVGIWYRELNINEVNEIARNGIQETAQPIATTEQTAATTGQPISTTGQTADNSTDLKPTEQTMEMRTTEITDITSKTTFKDEKAPISSTSLLTTTSERPFWYSWTIETVIAVTCGIIIATSALVLSGVVFYCILFRRKRKRRKPQKNLT